MIKFKSAFFIMILTLSFLAAAEGLSPVSAESEYDFSKGDLSGAIRADISNVNYTDLGASLLGLNSESNPMSRSLDKVVVRAAFSIEAAVWLMDAYDDRIFNEQGVRPFTAVPGTTFTSATLEDYAGFFDDDSDFRLSGAYITEDGNSSLTEDSYRANVSPDAFETSDWDGLNSSEVENLDATYSDLTDDMVENDEDQDDFKEQANDLVTAGLDNLEATILDVLQKAVANDDTVNVPASRIRIDNYTLTEAYHEQAMTASLGDVIIDSYEEAKSAGFLSNFKLKSPLKFSTVSLGQKHRIYKDPVSGSMTTQKPKTFDAVRGSTFVTSLLAFKKNIVKGTTSTLTGIKESARTGFSKITDGFAAVKSGTQKLKSKAFAWFNGFSTKLKSVLKWGVIILAILILLYVIYQVRMMSMLSRFKK